MDATARTSRRRLIAMLSAVTVVHAGVVLTSEREGPGSAQLRSTQAGAAPAPVPPNDSTAVAAGPAVPPTAVPTSIAPPVPTATTAAPPTTVPASPTTVPAAATAPTAAPAATSAPPVASPPAPVKPVAASAPEAGYAEEPVPTPRPVQAAAPKPTEAPKAALPPTQTMPGGRNNYVPNAPMVPNLGKGFVVAGTVLDAATGEPVRNTRVQIWLNTARGGEREPSNRGSVVTDALGMYRLETSPVMPVFGQPHVHIGYDDGKFGTLFLRPVLKSEKDPSITVDFVLGPNSAA